MSISQSQSSRHHVSGETRWAMWLVDACLFLVSGLASFLLRFDFRVPESEREHLAVALIVWTVAKLIAFRALNITRGSWRFVSIYDLGLLALGNFAGALLGAIVILNAAPAGFPRSLYVLDLLVCFLMTAGVRVGVRMYADFLGRRDAHGARKRVFIYGAGVAGVTLLRDLRSTPGVRHVVCGFIDDDPHKRGVSIQGVPVLGSGCDLRGLAARLKVTEVLIAAPSVTGAETAAIFTHCREAGVACRAIPGLTEMIEGGARMAQTRDVAVEDLLARRPARLERDEIMAKLCDKTVLVTGAAGSIGAELCRQIARFHPAAVIGYEIAESALFYVELEMSRTLPRVPFYPEIGSVQNARRLSEVFDRYRPSIVYHAAAYKHVPLMEAHLFEAVENNVFGTLFVALAAADSGVEDFVLISSDKAVRPTNVMGATKRLAELLVRSLQNGAVKYVTVRFGNVLGSNGSVIPTFKDQIARGGPVTVTHPEMRRYFMTIREACQLVLQASTMGNGGEIFVLDMGEPVRIIDLARKLILLSGLQPGEDIKIEFSGIRPGEKLYEELNLSNENLLATRHEKIRIFEGASISRSVMDSSLNALRTLCECRDLPGVILLLKDLIPDYNPSVDILRRAMGDSARVAAPCLTLCSGKSLPF